MANAIESKRMLSAREVGELIGKSATTVVRWSQQRTANFPPASVCVGHPRWRRTVVEDWLREQERRR